MTDFLTPDQLLARWGNSLSLHTLKMWRYRKKGPPYVKIGKRVLYRTSAIAAWESKNEVTT